MQSSLEAPLPGSSAPYARTLQAHDAVPSNAFTILQRWIVIPSALLFMALLPRLIRHLRAHILGLATIIVPVLIANALVTAVLSSSDSRYQARIIWLLPLLAALALLDMRQTQPVPQNESLPPRP
jgi:hypothetical protein